MMTSKKIKVKYEAWLSAETMHEDSLKWLSELNFAKDEELFFDDLVKSYTLQLIDSKHFTESKNTIDQLSALHKETNTLINTIIEHEKELKIMVDGVNELEKETAYKEEHSKLKIIVDNFLEKYKTFKKQMFSLIKGILKEGKQKRLLKKE